MDDIFFLKKKSILRLERVDYEYKVYTKSINGRQNQGSHKV